MRKGEDLRNLLGTGLLKTTVILLRSRMSEETKSILDKKIPLWVIVLFFAIVCMILGGVSSQNKPEVTSSSTYIIRNRVIKRLGPDLLFAEIRVTITDQTATD